MNVLHISPNRPTFTSRTVRLSQGRVQWVLDYSTRNSVCPEEVHERRFNMIYNELHNHNMRLAQERPTDQPASGARYHLVVHPYKNCHLIRCLTLNLTESDAYVLRGLYG